MAYETNLPQLSAVAGADLTLGQFKAVKIDSNGAIVACAAGEDGVGILQDNPNTGQVGLVWMNGISKGQFGGSVAKGASVTPDVNGKFVTAGGGDKVWGVCLTGGSANTVGTIALSTRAAVAGTARAGGNVISFPITLAAITGAGDVVTAFTPGFAGTIVGVSFLVTSPVTTALKAAALNVEIGTTNLTGGVVSLTSANCTPLGATVAGTAVTANNSFTASDTISVEAAAVTAFAEGTGVLLISVV